MSRILLLWLLLSQAALASTPTPINYAIDGNGQMVDLSGYSLQSDGNKPKRIELRNAENLFGRSQYLRDEFRESDPWGNFMQRLPNFGVFGSPTNRDDQTEPFELCPSGSP